MSACEKKENSRESNSNITTVDSDVKTTAAEELISIEDSGEFTPIEYTVDDVASLANDLAKRDSTSFQDRNITLDYHAEYMGEAYEVVGDDVTVTTTISGTQVGDSDLAMGLELTSAGLTTTVNGEDMPVERTEDGPSLKLSLPSYKLFQDKDETNSDAQVEVEGSDEEDDSTRNHRELEIVRDIVLYYETFSFQKEIEFYQKNDFEIEVSASENSVYRKVEVKAVNENLEGYGSDSHYGSLKREITLIYDKESLFVAEIMLVYDDKRAEMDEPIDEDYYEVVEYHYEATKIIE